MKKLKVLSVIVCITVIWSLSKCGTSPNKLTTEEPPRDLPATDASHKAAYETRDFPDFGAMISVDTFLKKYPGSKIFKLSQDYPRVQPGSQIFVPQKPKRQGFDIAKAGILMSAISALITGIALITK